MGDGPLDDRSLRFVAGLAADALSASGFAATTEHGAGRSRIVATKCPFGPVAIEHPVICSIDRGLVAGLLDSLDGEAEVAGTASVARGDGVGATVLADPADGTAVELPLAAN